MFAVSRNLEKDKKTSMSRIARHCTKQNSNFRQKGIGTKLYSRSPSLVIVACGRRRWDWPRRPCFSLFHVNYFTQRWNWKFDLSCTHVCLGPINATSGTEDAECFNGTSRNALPLVAAPRCIFIFAESPLTSVNLVFRAIAGWLASWVRFRYAARLSCSSITSACSSSLNLRAKNLFLISRKFPFPTSILKGSLMMQKRPSFWISCHRP